MFNVKPERLSLNRSGIARGLIGRNHDNFVTYRSSIDIANSRTNDRDAVAFNV